jgi:hypothetical protein
MYSQLLLHRNRGWLWNHYFPSSVKTNSMNVMYL